MKLIIFIIQSFALILLISGCAQPKEATHQSLTTQQLPILLDFKALTTAKNGTHSYKISPDGEKLAWLKESFDNNGNPYTALHFKNLKTGETSKFSSSIPFFEWMPDSRRLIYVPHFDDMKSKIFFLDTKFPTRQLTPFYDKDNQIHVVDKLRNDPENIIVRHNGGNAKAYNLYRLNIKTKKEKLLFKVDKELTIDGFIIDDRVKGGSIFAYIKDNRKIYQFGTDKLLFDAGENGKVTNAKMNHSKNTLTILANNNSDKIQLIELDLATNDINTLYSNDTVDVDKYYYDNNHAPALAASYPNYQEIITFNPNYKKLASTFYQKGKNGIFIFSTDNKNEKFTVKQYNEYGYNIYLYDTTNNKKELLSQSKSNNYTQFLASQKPIQFTSRDGLTLNGYITLPKGIKANNLPTVLLVHGGPHARDYWGFSYEAQLLANRGYAVIQVNFRGSTGYGYAFTSSGYGEFSKAMHNDLIDGVNWAVKQGITDPNNVAIMGASYGGYATLVGMTLTPDKFSCGVDIFGISDLELMVKNFPEPWKRYEDIWVNYIGDFNDPEMKQQRAQQSPINFVNNMNAPLLVIQGDSDAVVIPEQSRRFVEAAKKAGKNVQYWEMNNVGHHYGTPRQARKLARKVDNFLSQCIGGRSAG
ncbi:S9 family peptidase [Photobacterium sp. GB-36]|uniref:S9 family peptidase n=1 Tax=Photobacterium sp. GB-36 TaxID=2022108 RepID=UPI000D168FE8|nr:S9 family peptidase [Photobacterium sp. GB-36]PSV41830.1 S9 family peptidase [Photobacterium sp. GB-36]